MSQRYKDMAKKDFNEFRFGDLNFKKCSNKYLTMDRINADSTKIVVRIADEHIFKTKYGFGLILDSTHVCWLKSWQVSQNYFQTNILLQKEYFKPVEFGNFEDFDENPENLKFETWLNVAKEQREREIVDEDGQHLNIVKWGLAD